MPYPITDFDMATMLEDQRAGFSSRPNLGLMQHSSSVQKATNQQKAGKGRRTEACSHQAPSLPPISSLLSSPMPEPLRQRTDVEGNGKEGCICQPASPQDGMSLFLAGMSKTPPQPQMQERRSESVGRLVLGISLLSPHSEENARQQNAGENEVKGACSRQATFSSDRYTAPGPSSPLLATQLLNRGRRTPDRTFKAPRVSWSTFRAMSPFEVDFEEGSEESLSSSSSFHEEESREKRDVEEPTQLPNPPFRHNDNDSAVAVSTAQYIHLRSVSGEVSEIDLQQDIEQLPSLCRCPPRQRPQTPFPTTSITTLLGPYSTASPQNSRPSLVTHMPTPSGSWFLEHVNANGEAMYKSRVQLVGSRSSVALEVFGLDEEGDDGVERVIAEEGMDEDEEGGKSGGRKKKGWRKVFCFA